jgi:hypothetical protein
VHEEAQATIYNAAFKACQSDWLLVVDADEFVFGPIPIRELLQMAPLETSAIQIPTAEAVWGPGDDINLDFGSTYFRTPIPRASRLIQRIVYKDNADLFHMGLLGHYVGKHFVRKEAEIDSVTIHSSISKGRSISRHVKRISPVGRRFYVAHFDAIGFDRWKKKWSLRYTGATNMLDLSSKRTRQMKIVKDGINQGEETAKKVFSKLNSINRIQWVILRMLGLAMKAAVFPKNQRGDI